MRGATYEETRAQARRERAETIILGIDPGTRVMGYGVLRAVGNKAEALALGVVDMRRTGDTYLRLGHIYERVTGIIDEYKPDEMAIESQYMGVNAQSMLKLGRAQGVAIAAAIERDVPICEYAPTRVKMAITGRGSASKEQVAGMLTRMLRIEADNANRTLDATDALAVAYCHFIERRTPKAEDGEHYKSWKDYARRNGKV